MKQQGQGAGTANDGGKRQGWGNNTNHVATHYRAERGELRNRDCDLEKRAGEQEE